MPVQPDGRYFCSSDEVHVQAEIVELADKANKEHGFQIKRGANDKSCVLRSGYVSLAVTWHQPILNRVTDHGSDKCSLNVTEFSGTVLMPGELGFVIEQPNVLKRHSFKVGISDTLELIWKESGKKEILTATNLSDRIFRIFLDLISRDNKGKISRPFI